MNYTTHITSIAILLGSLLCLSPLLHDAFRGLLEWWQDRAAQRRDDRAKALRELADVRRWAIQPEDEE